MISFPTSSWQHALVRKATRRHPRNNTDGGVASSITPRLYLSDLHTARTAGNLERLGITHVVSALEVDVRKDFGNSVTVMHVPILDSTHVDITPWFDKVVRFIQDALDADEKNKVLVHCFQGISRSTTLVCAYLVATTPMRATEAIAHVQSKRGIAAPNLGFRRQLVAWGRQFDDAKAKAAQERRRETKSMRVFGDTLNKWMAKAR